jgi:Ca2+:H+ antiporter
LAAPPAPDAQAAEGAAVPGPLCRREAALGVIVATALLFAALGHGTPVSEAESWIGAAMFAWLFLVIVAGSASVVRHADCLALLLGEPYGTLILTLSVAGIEIMTVSRSRAGGPTCCKAPCTSCCSPPT